MILTKDILYVLLIVAVFVIACDRDNQEVNKRSDKNERKIDVGGRDSTYTPSGERESKLSILIEEMEDKGITYKEKVIDLIREVSKKERVKYYIELAVDMSDIIKYDDLDMKNFHNLAKEIVLHEDEDVIVELERKLSKGTKKATIWRSVRSWMKGSRKRDLLSRWAVENPDVISLLPYHPEGYEKLTAMIENENLHPNKRALCIKYITDIADKRTIKILVKLKDDKSIFGFASMKKPRTLGGYASEKIVEIKNILKARD